MSLLLLIGGIVFGVAPVGLAIGAGALGASLGCEVHEGFANPCPLWGVDIGGLLYQFGVLGWLSLVTLPAGAAVSLAGIVGLVLAALGVTWTSRPRRGP